MSRRSSFGRDETVQEIDKHFNTRSRDADFCRGEGWKGRSRAGGHLLHDSQSRGELQILLAVETTGGIYENSLIGQHAYGGISNETCTSYHPCP